MRKFLGVLSILGLFSAGAENLSFIGDTDKDPLSYKLNETITFTVKLVDKDANNAAVAGRELRWTLSHDEKTLDKSGTATSDNPLVVTTAMSKPGFARLVVEVKDGGAWLNGTTQVFDGGAGADVLNIQEWPEPADFRSFWTTATNTLYTTAYTPVCTNFVPAGAAAGVQYFLFELPTLPGLLPATGILAKPEGADPASCGVVATFNGYGFGATALPNAATVLKGNIVINVARHGEYPVHPDASYYTDLQNGPMKSFCFRNLDGTVQQTDQYGMILRDLRALQFAKSLPEWNHETVEVSGGSMGGYQSLAMAGLDADVTKCTVNIPWHVDLSSGVKYGRMTGWRPEWTANMDYVDAKNFAKLIHCPVTFTAGLGDYVCPPSGEVLLWKNLPEPKKVTWTQNSSHPGNRGPVCAQYVWQAPEPEPELVPGRTLNWVGGGANKLFSTALNWKDAAGGTNAVPQDGDVLKIATNTGDAKNDIPNLHPYQIRMNAYQTQSSGGEPLILQSGSGGIYNEGYLHFDLPIALVGTNVPYYSSSTCVQRGRIFGLDGKDCGIVKLGAQRAGINGANVASAADYAGFRFVTIREGQWIYGINGGATKMNLLPKGQTVTFDGQGTSLGISQACVFEDFGLYETPNARNKAHAITCQVDNGTDVKRGKLTVTGTPPADDTVFTGTFETSVDFCWNPTSSLKTFTLSGRTSTTTGTVEIANGTLRLTAGAGYSQLGELKLSGGAGARLVVDTAPHTAFHADKLVLINGTERLQLAAGVTLTVGGVTIAGVRLPARTYTRANADWITGDGAVIVEGLTPCTLTWAKKATYLNLKWSNKDNWINETTGLPDVPVDGDTINLPGRYVYDAGGQAGRTDNNQNDLVNFRPRRIYVQGGYSGPSGNPVIFDGTDPMDGIYNNGYMFYNVPTVVNTAAITINVGSGASYGHRADIYSTDGGAFTIRKMGGGLLGLSCQTTGRNKYTGFRHLEIHEGKFSFSWQKWGIGDSFPQDLDICYMAKDTYLQCSVDTTLRGAVIREASTAANQTHYLGAQNGEVVTLTLAGDPAEDSLFTGVLQDPLSFTWAPENAERSFTFSGASSKNLTKGTLTVNNGAVVLKDGATFTQLSTLALDGEGACFRVESAPATAFHADALTVASGAERLYIEGGVKLAVDALTVGEQSLAAGVYHSTDNAGGTGVAWITGGGYLCVGGADVVLPTESTETVVGLWTAGGGSDTAVGTAANWEGQVLPDLATGSLNVTFAAGSAAALDRDAHFKGVTFNAPGSGFALTRAAGSSFVNYLGSLGLSTAGGTGKTYTLAMPTYLVAPQTWTVGAKDVLDVNGPLVG
ncbi:MAG: acetylxylan esterase, partial [bacterium]|nr:acetylxylan esterase [bacterium]